MPVATNWYDPEKTMIHIQFKDAWTWQDYRDATGRAAELCASVPHRVDYLADFLGSGPLPKDAIQQVKNRFDTHPDNWGCTVVIQRNLFIKVIAQTFERLYPKMGDRFILADSMEDGLQKLAERCTQNTT